MEVKKKAKEKEGKGLKGWGGREGVDGMKMEGRKRKIESEEKEE